MHVGSSSWYRKFGLVPAGKQFGVEGKKQYQCFKGPFAPKHQGFEDYRFCKVYFVGIRSFFCTTLKFRFSFHRSVSRAFELGYKKIPK